MLIRKKIPIRWSSPVHPRSLDAELLELAARSGCHCLGFGFESGSQRVLDILGKGSTVERNIEVTKLCKKYGIEITAFILVGSPTETRRDIQMTWKFLQEAMPTRVRVSALVPYPGTWLWKDCQAKGLVPPVVDFSKFYFHHASIRISEFLSLREVEGIKWRMLFSLYLLNPGMRRNLIKDLFRRPMTTVANIFDSLSLTHRPAVKKNDGTSCDCPGHGT